MRNVLQEEGLDTVDANRALGLPDDCREYSSVRNILQNLGIRSIRLMVRTAPSPSLNVLQKSPGYGALCSACRGHAMHACLLLVSTVETVSELGGACGSSRHAASE